MHKRAVDEASISTRSRKRNAAISSRETSRARVTRETPSDAKVSNVGVL